MTVADELPARAASFPGGGETGALVRAHDWAATPLGAIETWPQSLRTIVATCLDCGLPAVVWWGPELVTVYNGACVPILGAARHPHALGARGRDAWPEVWDEIGPLVKQVMADGRAARSRDLVLATRGDGDAEEAYFAFSCSPVRDETGAVAGVFCPVIETTGRILTERRERVLTELSEADGAHDGDAMFRAVADHAPAIIWLGDVDGRTAWLSRGWHELTGQAADHPPHDAWYAAAHPEDGPRVRETFLEATARRAPFRTEYRLRRTDGSHVWVLDSARPRLTEDGRYLGHIGAIMDIDDRRRAEQHRTLLIDELNHRVKNTLSIVQGIAHQSLRSDESLAPALSAFEGRLGALAAAHSLLTRLNWEAAALDELVRAAIRPVCGDDDARVEVTSVPVRLPPKQAVSITIALHELATNALKYGALSAEHGRVVIDWKVCRSDGDGTPPRLRFSWIESGGPPVAPPGKRGFGSRLIERALAAELGGAASLDFRSEGVACHIEAPLNEGKERA